MSPPLLPFSPSLPPPPSRRAVSCLTSDYPASDRPYIHLGAQRHSLHSLSSHSIIDLPLESFLSHAQFCIRVLKTFDGMTLRNSIVIAAAMVKAKELGSKAVLTGDAADELLGGYSFMWGEKDPLK
jgi:asparagine synthetase B (glutamine-hydrolysing)